MPSIFFLSARSVGTLNTVPLTVRSSFSKVIALHYFIASNRSCQRIKANLDSYKTLLIFSFKKSYCPPTMPGHPTRFHLSGAHQTTSLYPAGNRCWCASISITIPICFQVPLLPMSMSPSISLGGTYISWASVYSSLFRFSRHFLKGQIATGP